MTSPGLISRRALMVSAAAAGGGLLVGVACSAAVDDGPDRPTNDGGRTASDTAEFTAWIQVAADGAVTIRVPTPEIGNGVLTQVAMTVTEELDCDWSAVRTEFAPVDRDYREGGVYSRPGGFVAYFSGRSTDAARHAVLLQAGASARERLKAAAARRWRVPVSEVTTHGSVVTHSSTGRTLRYGEVATAAARVRLIEEPKPKSPKDWWFLGRQSPGKLNNAAIVAGTAEYGIDVKVPGKLYAALLQAPVHGGRIRRYDFSAIERMPGVRGIAVVDPSEKRAPLATKTPFPLAASAPQSAIAVVATHYWQARKALEALPVEWEDGPGAQWRDIDQMIDQTLAALDAPGRRVEVSAGDARATLANAGRTRIVEATYLTPYCDQAPMEVLNGVARVAKDRVDVWHPSQHSQQAFFIAAEEAGVAPEKVFFHQTFVGGAFGRRVFGDDVRMVVAVAKHFPGSPVHVIWSREEMMRQGRYRPLHAARFRAALRQDGTPEAMQVHVAGNGLSAKDLGVNQYSHAGAIPNIQVEYSTLPFHLLTGSYRGPGYNTHAFMLESFIDECAVAASVDPLSYRLKLLERWPDPAWANCLREAARQAGWGKPLPKGQAQGIAIGNWGFHGKPEHGTTVAAVVTIEATADDEIHVRRIDLAFDSGGVLNRDAVRANMEGGALFGLNMTMNEELTVQDGRVVQGNFDTYPIMRMGDVPRLVNVHFGALSGHSRLSEVGEAPVGPIGPAIGAAIFRLTGKRLRSTPFRGVNARRLNT